MKKQLFFCSGITLTIGGVIYVLFRSESLKLFVWLDKINCLEIIKSTRDRTLKITNVMPNWMLYALPDGLWLSSYVCLMLMIWKNIINKENAVWIFSMPIMAVLSEVGQFFKIFPGTFDWMDVVMYLLGTVFPLMICRKNKTNN
ncbi:hypothetical protein LZZ90_09835 [Flavobacterium sp. SM15]|uniref:hypothetical protein n=1 Tax=Flavobacterium sp. SM15 TaxID=2908005 RepID=UPI001EDB4357|nr:hypothetical protein [Flavobacterium sp. SM15]MCG2611803.1 hypothetical protein [Flavobacterium sp. SM15]